MKAAPQRSRLLARAPPSGPPTPAAAATIVFAWDKVADFDCQWKVRVQIMLVRWQSHHNADLTSEWNCSVLLIWIMTVLWCGSTRWRRRGNGAAPTYPLSSSMCSLSEIPFSIQLDKSYQNTDESPDILVLTVGASLWAPSEALNLSSTVTQVTKHVHQATKNRFKFWKLDCFSHVAPASSLLSARSS